MKLILRLFGLGTLLLTLGGCENKGEQGPSPAALSSFTSTTDVDVLVVGATPAGLIAGIAAADFDVSVLVVDSGPVAGGMITGGLGGTDVGIGETIGGLSRTFFERVGQVYGTDLSWRFEPKVAAQVFGAWWEEAGVEVVGQRRLIRVEVEEGRAVRAHFVGGLTVSAKIMIDASYEGDLIAAAGIPFSVGRENREAFGEPLAGVSDPSFNRDLFPAGVRGVDASGRVLPFILSQPPGVTGTADAALPAYNYRLCLTQDPKLKLRFRKPEGYDRSNYALVEQCLAHPEMPKALGEWFTFLKLPGDKVDLNNRGALSTDLVGGNTGYLEADEAGREAIRKKHRDYIEGLLYFLANDKSSPDWMRGRINTWGHSKDEFVDTGNWPHALYVREGRRMQSDFVLTQRDVLVDREKSDAVGMGSNFVESHHVRRYATPAGDVQNEGFVHWRSVGRRPYDIPYRALVPPRGSVSNVLVPVAVSSTHVGFSSVRMEPIYMILGESVGVAAAQALANNQTVQEINMQQLQRTLEQRGVRILANQPELRARFPQVEVALP